MAAPPSCSGSMVIVPTSNIGVNNDSQIISPSCSTSKVGTSLVSSVNQTFTKVYLSHKTRSPQAQQHAAVASNSESSSPTYNTSAVAFGGIGSPLEDAEEDSQQIPKQSTFSHFDDAAEESDGATSPLDGAPMDVGGEAHNPGTRFSSSEEKSEHNLFSQGLRFFGGNNEAQDAEEDDAFGEVELMTQHGDRALSQYSLLSNNSVARLSPQSVAPASRPSAKYSQQHQQHTPQPSAPAAKSSGKSIHRASSAAPSKLAYKHSGARFSVPNVCQDDMPSMSSLYNRTASNTAEARRKQVRERRTQLHQSFRRDKERGLEGSRMRLENAVERKAVMSNQMATQRHWAWATLAHIASFAGTLASTARNAALRKKLHAFLMPKVYIFARRWLRRTRERTLCATVKKPVVAELSADRTLGLFAQNHLEHLLGHLQLRYYFLNETIIFMGCEDDECFVLASGSVDVLVGHTTVGHIGKAGAVFGSVGMISGEPRTASIVAREPTLVWVCTRAKFEAFGMADNRVQEALGIIADLRQSNLRVVYKRYITANYFGSFSPMKDLATSTREALLGGAAPMVTKAGVRIVQPYAASNTATHRCFFLLRGSVKIMFTPMAIGNMGKVDPPPTMVTPLTPASAKATPGTTLREYVQRLVQFPLRGARVTFEEESPRGATVVHPELVPLDNPKHVSTITEGSVVVVLKGPLILNIYPLIVNEAPLPFTVETVGGCDMLYMTRQQLMAMDPVEIDNVRRQCLGIHREFVVHLTPRALRLAICRGPLAASAHSFLKGLDVKKPHVRLPEQRPDVLSAGDILHFDPDHGMVAYVILSGQLQGVASPANGEPYLWPDLHLVYYGSVNAKATVVTQMDVIRLHRREIVDWLVTQLVTKDMELYVSAMTQAFEASLHRKPHFSFEGIDNTATPDDSSANPVSRDCLRRRKSMMALHRTNNFTVSTDAAEQTRASQNRSISAALVYQEATGGRQALLRKRSTVTKLQKLQDHAAKLNDKEDASEDQNAPGALESDQAPTTAPPVSESSFTHGAQREFVAFALASHVSSAATLPHDSSMRSTSPLSSLEFHDYSQLTHDDFAEEEEHQTIPSAAQSKSQRKPEERDLSSTASVRFMGTEQCSARCDDSLNGQQKPSFLCAAEGSHATSIARHPPRTPRQDLRSLEEFELLPDAFAADPITPLPPSGTANGAPTPWRYSMSANASVVGPSSYAQSSSVMGTSVMGNSCGQIVVNRKSPLAAGRHTSTFDRSMFGASGGSLQDNPLQRSPSTVSPSAAGASVMEKSAFSNASTYDTREPDHSRSANSSFVPRSPQCQPPSNTSPRMGFQHAPPGTPQRPPLMSSSQGMATFAAASSVRMHPARMAHAASVHASSVNTDASPISPTVPISRSTPSVKRSHSPQTATSARPASQSPQRGASQGKPRPQPARARDNIGALISSIRTSTASVNPASSGERSIVATVDKWFGTSSAKSGTAEGEEHTKVQFLPTQHPKPKNESAERRKLLRGKCLNKKA